MSNLYAGIDVGAESLDVCLMKGKKAEHRVFGNDDAGCAALVKWLREEEGVRCVMEATGTYFLLAATTLHKHGIPCMVVNPLVAKDLRSVLGRRAKTDKVDAKVLAKCPETIGFQEWRPISKEAGHLRLMLRRQQQLKKIHKAESSRLHALVRVPSCPDVLLKELKKSLEALQKKIDRYDELAKAWVKSNADLHAKVKTLQSIPGVGFLTAILIVAETAALPDDMTPRQWVAYAGLDPAPYQSGTSVHKAPTISKRGNSRLRAALFMPALAARVHSPHFKAFYLRLRNKGKPPLVARTAVMRKLLVAAWALLHQDSDDATFLPDRLFPLFSAQNA